jgi:predicted DNA binding CopG/RHH family protein
MQQTAESAPTATTSFAGLLAALTTPAQTSGGAGERSYAPGHRPASAWKDDDLADDIATLSYESALKAHARYRPTDQSLTQAADPDPLRLEDPEPAAYSAAPQAAAQPIANLESSATPEASRLRAAAYERNLKDASITIRMSKAESEQLHRRAAEAGLTVSAYLRSCTFEAESLRTMVKETLAQMRSVAAHASPAPPRGSWFREVARWMARLLTPWHGSQRVARA